MKDRKKMFLLLLITVFSCSTSKNDTVEKNIPNPFIVNCRIDGKSELYIEVINNTSKVYSISSLEYLCNVGIKAKKKNEYLPSLKVKVRCDEEATKLILIIPNERKEFKFSYNLKEYFVGFDDSCKIELHYYGKILENGEKVKLENPLIYIGVPKSNE